MNLVGAVEADSHGTGNDVVVANEPAVGETVGSAAFAGYGGIIQAEILVGGSIAADA